MGGPLLVVNLCTFAGSELRGFEGYLGFSGSTPKEILHVFEIVVISVD